MSKRRLAFFGRRRGPGLLQVEQGHPADGTHPDSLGGDVGDARGHGDADRVVLQVPGDPAQLGAGAHPATGEEEQVGAGDVGHVARLGGLAEMRTPPLVVLPSSSGVSAPTTSTRAPRDAP